MLQLLAILTQELKIKRLMRIFVGGTILIFLKIMETPSSYCSDKLKLKGILPSSSPFGNLRKRTSHEDKLAGRQDGSAKLDLTLSQLSPNSSSMEDNLDRRRP